MLCSRGIKAIVKAGRLDEILRDAEFAATDEHRFVSLIATVKAEISGGKMRPVFDKRDEFIKH